MRELGIALGLVLVLEGALYALFPRGMVRLLEQVAAMPPPLLRATGLAFVALGWFLVWWITH